MEPINNNIRRGKLMKKYILLIAISSILISCGVHEENGYKASTELELEGRVSIVNFALDEEGDILYWGELDVESGDDERTKIWTGEEIQELDIGTWDQWSHLTNSGKLIRERVSDTDEEETYTRLEYDPMTEETEEFTNDNEEEKEIKKAVKRKIKPTNALLEPIEPVVYLSDDKPDAWVLIKGDGIYHYDMETKKLEGIVFHDDMSKNYTGLTADDNFLIYNTYEQVRDYYKHNYYYSLDLDTLETKELNLKGVMGRTVALTNGNIAYVRDGNTIHMEDGAEVAEDDSTKIQEVDVATGEEKTLYEIKIKDSYELDLATISPDKSTIAYSYRKSKGDDGVIQVLKKDDDS